MKALLTCCTVESVAAETTCRIVECDGCGADVPECHAEVEHEPGVAHYFPGSGVKLSVSFCHTCCNVACLVCGGAKR